MSFIPAEDPAFGEAEPDPRVDEGRETGFVELMLEIIRDSLRETTVVDHGTDQDSDPVSH